MVCVCPFWEICACWRGTHLIGVLHPWRFGLCADDLQQLVEDWNAGKTKTECVRDILEFDGFILSDDKKVVLESKHMAKESDVYRFVSKVGFCHQWATVGQTPPANPWREWFNSHPELIMSTKILHGRYASGLKKACKDKGVQLWQCSGAEYVLVDV